MCLAVPAKIVRKSADGRTAEADFGGSILREVDLSLVEAEIGDYVLVHAGFAIEVLNPKEATETLKLWKELLRAGT
ncbi:MAG: HypC/HybG/HupF family hydrogenase formation chaperone [Candidatus Bathyarchaeia archaeon]